MKPIVIHDKKISAEHPCFIIAELSANHNKDIEKAKRLIALAKDAGADAVKVQTYTPETMTLNCDNEYFRINEGPWKGQTLYELYNTAFMPWEWQRELKCVADSLGIVFISTPFDSASVDFLESIEVPAYKIASFELVDLPLLKYVASKKKPVILSTGMGSLAEIEAAVAVVKEQGNNQIILLKCTSDYPALPKEMNLKNISLLQSTFNVYTGLSDHSLFNEVSVAAVTLGAKVIEKHFTEKRSDGGPDAHFSLESQEFAVLVKNIRIVEEAMRGNGFVLTSGELKNKMFRRSIFAARKITRGEVLTTQNIRVIRPGNGLAPKYYELILGKAAKRDIEFGEPVSWGHIDI